MRRDKDLPKESSLKQLVGCLALALVVTVGLVVGTRMSTDAIAVLVGVVAGVAASIPTALLLMAVTRRRDSERARRYDERRTTAPPVIVVTPGGSGHPQLPYPASYGYPASPAHGGRQFRVMGYDDEDEPPLDVETADVSWER